MSKNPTEQTAAQGHAMYFIIVGVIFLAALSYVVVQLSQTGQEETELEQEYITVGAIAQSAGAVKTEISKMILEGIPAQQIDFNCAHASSTPQKCLKNYGKIPLSAMEGSRPGAWYFNTNFYIEELEGIEGENMNGDQIIAFLPGIKFNVCERLNRQIGISDIPRLIGDHSASYKYSKKSGNEEQTEKVILGDTVDGTENLKGFPFGCFQNDGENHGEYVYYHLVHK